MEDYYIRQAGSGFVGYSGVRYQRGNGFFGRLISGGFVPLLKSVLPFLGKKAVDTGLNIANEMLDDEGPKDFKEVVKRNMKKAGKSLAKDAIVKVKEMRGKGVRRRRKANSSRKVYRGKKRRKKRKTSVKRTVKGQKPARKYKRKKRQARTNDCIDF